MRVSLYLIEFSYIYFPSIGRVPWSKYDILVTELLLHFLLEITTTGLWLATFICLVLPIFSHLWKISSHTQYRQSHIIIDFFNIWSFIPAERIKYIGIKDLKLLSIDYLWYSQDYSHFQRPRILPSVYWISLELVA